MDIQIEFRTESYIFLALLCLVIPVKWITALILAAIVHEMSHILMIFLTGERIHGIRIGLDGTVLQTNAMSIWRECICALAGPMGSFSMLLLAKYLPRTAFCSLVQGSYNMLPVYPLDGGRAVFCVLRKFFAMQKAQDISNCLMWVTIGLILCCGIWGSLVYNMGLLPAAASVFTLSRAVGRKIPCKARQVGVQ